MEFVEFLDYVKEHIMEHMPEEYQDRQPEIRTCKKAGKDVTCIRLKSEWPEAIGAEPVIVLESFYKRSQDGEELDGILEEIAGIYVKGIDEKAKLGLEKFATLGEVREYFLSNLITAVYPAEKIKDRGDIPYLQINDLALTAKVKLGEIGMISVTDDFAEQMQMDGDTILSMAMLQNRKNARAKLKSLTGMLEEQLDDEEISLSLPPEEIPLYVLTSSDYSYGASFIADKELLDMIAYYFQCRELIILPSSIHEIIIIPENQMPMDDMDQLRKMVMEVNKIALRDEELLSNNIYIYNSEKRELQMYAGQLQQEQVKIRKYDGKGLLP